MNSTIKSLMTIVICVIALILSGCSESQKAKNATEKLLKENNSSVTNFSGDFYEGYAPAFMDARVLNLAEDLNKCLVAEEKFPAIEEEYNKSHSYWDFFTRDRYWDAKRKVDKIPCPVLTGMCRSRWPPQSP